MKKIKKGQQFKCIKDFAMSDGEIAYKKGITYLSEFEGCLTDEQERKQHSMTLNNNFYEHFELIDNMKTQIIETPAGCKIAKTEIIEGNLIVTYERDLPESVKDIPNRKWYFDDGAKPDSLNNFSTKERAQGILALGQLIELASYVGCESVKVRFNFGLGKTDLYNDFHKKYADLIEQTKRLL